MNALRTYAVTAFAAMALGAGAAHADGAEGVRLPKFERVTRSNGAQLVLMEKHDTPLVLL